MATILSAQGLIEQLGPILAKSGYAPHAQLQSSGEPAALMQRLAQDVPAYWLGAPWGSLSFVGVRRADDLDQTGIAQLMDRAFQIAVALQPHSGKMAFRDGRSVSLGAYGRILFVWESLPHVPIAVVQRAKRGQFFKKCYVVPWCVLLAEGRVYGHKGLPFTMGAPSVGDIQRLLR